MENYTALWGDFFEIGITDSKYAISMLGDIFLSLLSGARKIY
jgi:hypothetical protein